MLLHLQIKKATSKVAFFMPVVLGPGHGLDYSRRDFSYYLTTFPGCVKENLPPACLSAFKAFVFCCLAVSFFALALPSFGPYCRPRSMA